MIVAANHVGNSHVVVVHHHRQHVGGGAVGAQQHHVVQLVAGHPDLALDMVADHGFPFPGRLEADDRIDARRRFRRVAVAPSSVVQHGPAGFFRVLAHFGQLFRRAVTTVGLAVGEEAFGRLGVMGGTRELGHHVAVPVQAQPPQAGDDGVHGFVRGPRPVGVLDAQAKAAAVMLGVEPVEQRRAGSADVKEARGRRGKAGDHRHGAICGSVHWRNGG